MENNPTVYRDIAEEERFFRAVQVGRYAHVYSITLRVRNDGDDSSFSPASRLRSAILQIEEDSEFHITHISAAVMAPTGTGISEVRDVNVTPTFAMAGVDSGRSDRGVAIRISEVGSGRFACMGQTRLIGPAAQLQGPTTANPAGWWAEQGYIPLEAMFPPAYSFEFAAPVPFEFYLARSKRLLVEMINRDSDNEDPVGQSGHRVTLSFIGNRYNA